jgi:sterol desaturase/sphingolipid hydroxylase (fatty acid hydroxylase superfamily)
LSQGFLLGLTAIMGVIYLATLNSAAQEVILSGASLVFILLSLGLERLYPQHEEWNQGQGDTAGDVASFVLVFAVLDGLLKYVTPFLIIPLLPDTALVIGWPLWAQIAAVTLLIELGAWASHWVHHRYRPFWALHAMHHSPERLYTLNNFRFHPVNYVLNHLAMFIVPSLLGFSTEALIGYAALTLPVLLFQHSNVGFEFGILNKVLNTNELHRWHHSAAPDEGMMNLGRALVVWDRIFGTYYNPGAGEPRKLGLFSSSAGYPSATRFWAQLVYPCCRQC